MKLGTSGASLRADLLDAREARSTAERLESLGYSALWLTDSRGRDPLVHASWLLASTETLVLASGIANIHLRSPLAIAGAQRALAEQSGGRFILGLGVSHSEIIEGVLQQSYTRPLATMRAYLDAMEGAIYQGPPVTGELPVVLAALGPKMLRLAAEKANGAFPLHVTPEYTARAREIMGPESWLCIKQYVVLETDAVRARAAARHRFQLHLGLENYRRNLLTLGFIDSDFEDGGSDRLVDAIIPYGGEQAIRDRVQAHLDAGADHVCTEPIDAGDPRRTDFRALEVLAPSSA